MVHSSRPPGHLRRRSLLAALPLLAAPAAALAQARKPAPKAAPTPPAAPPAAPVGRYLDRARLQPGQTRKGPYSLSVVGGLAWDPSGRYLFQFDFGIIVPGRVFLLNAGSFQPVREFRPHNRNVKRAVFTKDGKFIMTASADKTAKIWNILNGEVQQTFTGHTKALRSAVFSRDETKVLTASEDGTAILWDRQTAQPIRTYSSDGKMLAYAGFVGDNARIVTIGAGPMTLYDMATGAMQSQKAVHKRGAPSVDLSRDGYKFLTGGEDRTVVLTDLRTGESRQIEKGIEGLYPGVGFSPDGKLFAVSDSRQIKIYDAEDGAPLDLFDVPQEISQGGFTNRVLTAIGNSAPEFTFAIDSMTLIMGPLGDYNEAGNWINKYVEWRPNI